MSKLGLCFLRDYRFKRCASFGIFRNYYAYKQHGKRDWNRAIDEAKLIVNYPTSSVSLRWLLNDEMAYVFFQLRKLVESGHPILKTAEDVLCCERRNIQTLGLVVMLVSKIAGYNPGIPVSEQDKLAGILNSQRILAELTEMIRMIHLFHKSVIKLNSSLIDMNFGNKIAILIGDLILRSTSAELSQLRNHELSELIYSVMRDISETEFIGERDVHNIPLPSKPPARSEKITIMDDLDFQNGLEPFDVNRFLGHSALEWAIRHELEIGTLLGKSCQGALILAKQSKDMQRLAKQFGSYFILAWQACKEIKQFSRSYIGPFSLVSAPVIFTLHDRPSLYSLIEAGSPDVNNVDYDLLYKEVSLGPGIKQTKELQSMYSDAATKVLQNFPNSEAKTALQNMIVAMQDDLYETF